MNKAEAKKRAAQLYKKALVWDDHSGFDPHGGADLKNLEIWRKAGVHYLSVNVGYDVVDWQATVKTLARFRAWLQTHPKKYALVKTTADIKRARKDGKLAIAYNLENLAGGGCHDGNVGLTSFGRDVIKEMNRVGMVVDCSHTAYRTTME